MGPRKVSPHTLLGLTANPTTTPPARTTLSPTGAHEAAGMIMEDQRMETCFHTLSNIPPTVSR